MARWQNPEVSTAFDRYREPVQPLLRQIAQTVIGRSLPEASGPQECLELGSGTGQLRHWLPAWVAAGTLHTDMSPGMLDELQRQHPAAQAQVADAGRLPHADGRFAAVLGLCTVDSFPQQREVRDEIRRVLAKGGCFIHLMDMQSSPAGLFTHLVQRGELPLPNFLDDTLLGTLDPVMRGRLPQPKVLDDFVAVPHNALARMVDVLHRCGSPQAAELAPFVQRFAPGNFTPAQTTDAFMSLLADAERIGGLNRTLLSLWLQFGAGQHEEVPAWPLRPVSSLRFVQRRFETLFSPAEGFRVEFSDLVSLRQTRPRESGMPQGQRFHLRCAGRSLWLSHVPPNELGRPLASLEPPPQGNAAPAAPPEDSVVIEAGMYVFIARKLGSDLSAA
jgi:ubiquinone/menaquinone biosynthesis C-methylase UbiE